jgi:hypothetical protein
MKNIHVLPTDKPSRLCLDSKDKLWFAPNSGYTIADGKQNIYITNDEEIKEGDNVILKSGRLTKAEISQGVLGFKTIDGVAFLYFQEGDKKVILTTDQDLIKDGVQAIDDEFLDWFVKNPSCEYVEIREEEVFVGFIDGNGKKPIYDDEYKIIIPKEEPKQSVQEYEQQGLEKYSYELKQETVEEASDRIRKELIHAPIGIIPNFNDGFEQGVKWQQEQDKNKFSEEDLISFAHFYFKEEFNSTMQTSKSTNEVLQEWKEFKKK